MSIFRADKCQKWQQAFLVISISTSSNQSSRDCRVSNQAVAKSIHLRKSGLREASTCRTDGLRLCDD
jgi:hypothetical protein